MKPVHAMRIMLKIILAAEEYLSGSKDAARHLRFQRVHQGSQIAKKGRFLRRYLKKIEKLVYEGVSLTL